MGSYLYNAMASFIGLPQGFENINYLIQSRLKEGFECINGDSKICLVKQLTYSLFLGFIFK